LKSTFFSFLGVLAITIPASAITITTPTNGAEISSPFKLVASTDFCDSKQAVSMGYSIDYGATTITKTSFSAMVVAGDGPHVLHVKCWGPQGALENETVNITVVPSTAPSKITTVSNLQALGSWVWNHDPGTHGSSTGTSEMASTPSESGNARRMSMRFSDSGGEIYHVSFGKDTAATHFVYEAKVWIDNPADISNIEMDMNQVVVNGDTIIYGVQCDGYSGTWDYTINKGTRTKHDSGWVHSNVACPAPRTWASKTWHQIQISYSRDGSGNVTYESVVLDGDQSEFVGAKGNSSSSLGWGQTLLTNFQIDGEGANGSANVYVDNLTVSRW
jgi:hypothetical protein